jgi:3-oxoacyl-[acyl-carrier protein] reductase
MKLNDLDSGLADKVALVTGASRGIGQAIAETLAIAGVQVIGTATTTAGAEHITNTLRIHHNKCCGIVLDVTSQASIDKAVVYLKQNFVPLSILINNAAVTEDSLLLRMTEEQWLKVLETNLTAVYRLSKIFLRDMLKLRWGRIINIGSVVGSSGNFGQTNYAATKAGLVGFSKALACEVGARNITVNTVAPGFIATDMTNKLTQEQQELLLQKIPLQRLGSVADVAAVVLFLASAQASYITGQVLHVNGGMYMA